MLCMLCMLCLLCMLCYVMLCYVMFCYVMLCYVMLCYGMYVCMYVCMYVYVFIYIYIHPFIDPESNVDLFFANLVVVSNVEVWASRYFPRLIGWNHPPENMRGCRYESWGRTTWRFERQHGLVSVQQQKWDTMPCHLYWDT